MFSFMIAALALLVALLGCAVLALPPTGPTDKRCLRPITPFDGFGGMP
jgi:hypothetical protein